MPFEDITEMLDNSEEDVRNQFLLDTVTYDNRTRNARDADNDFDFSSNTPYQYSTRNTPYQYNVGNNHYQRNPMINNHDQKNIDPMSYELDSFREIKNTGNQHFPNQAENPFDSNDSYSDSTPANPFRDAELPPLPYNTYQNDKEYPLLPAEPSEEERIKQNDIARSQQLSRKPRFHYTKLPYFTIIVTIIQVCVFIAELAKMSHLTGSAFQTKPYFNPMLGPSTYLLINMGARYVPCMQSIENITNDTSILFPCPNSTSYDTDVCQLPELCGLGGIPIENNTYEPHQWYRLIAPMFLHAGFLHIIFNLLLQIVMGASIERHIGFIKYFIIYLMSGVSGFLLGANFSPRGIASTGASGSLFGILATNILLFIYCGKKNTNLYGTKHYALFILIMIGEIVVSIVLGLLPGLDNFSHIGGFAMGILLSVLLLPDPFFVYEDGIITYNAYDNTMQQFYNNWNPFYHFEDKVPLNFYIWCSIRVIALVLVIVYMALLVKNFFNNGILPEESTCHWCKYINCIPVNGWCDSGDLSVQDVSSTSNTSSPTESINSSESTTSPTQTSTTSAAAITYPTSINNPNSNSNAGTSKRLDSNEYFHEAQNVGVGLYVLLMFLTYSFCKKKKIL